MLPISLPTVVIGALAHGDQLNQRRIYGTWGGEGGDGRGRPSGHRYYCIRPTNQPSVVVVSGSVSVYSPGLRSKTRAKIGWFADVKAFRTHPGEYSPLILLYFVYTLPRRRIMEGKKDFAKFRWICQLIVFVSFYFLHLIARTGFLRR